MTSPISITDILGLSPATDVMEIGRALSAHIERYAKGAQDKPVAAELAYDLDKAIEKLFHFFYLHVDDWLKKNGGKAKDGEAVNLQEKGRQNLQDLQSAVSIYALTLIDINRSMGLLRKRVDSMPVEGEKKKIQWTIDTRRLMNRNIKECAELIERRGQLNEGLAVLEKADGLYENTENSVSLVKGAEGILSSYRSGLRMLNFDKARKAIKDIGQKTNGDQGLVEHCRIIEEHKDNLTSAEGKLFLNAKEARLALDTIAKDLEQKQKFIRKYQKPFVEHQIVVLSRMREKMQDINSLSGLLDLYCALVSGLGSPLDEMRDLRQFEAGVIEKIEMLQKGPFETIQSTRREVYLLMEDVDEQLERYAKYA